jgi:acyl-coenzyme A thioesterase PaaI-like protein
MIESSIAEILQDRLGDKIEDFLIPPPVFELMHGEFLTFDVKSKRIKTRFPVLAEYQNPYRTMQGGMVAAAVDNTLGPLSMLVAPPNVTRRLEMKYSHPITIDLEYITVEGILLKRDGRRLTFRADVRDQEGKLLARGKSYHWIIDENGE